MGWDRRLLTGSAVLFGSSLVVNAGNYLFNLVLARWLGPSDFADLSLMVSLLLVVTLITTTLQMTSSKFAAAHTADGDAARLAALRGQLRRWAYRTGVAVGLLLVVAAPGLRQFFQTESPWPFVLLAIGLPFLFAQGVDRGLLQGQLRFRVLALSYQAEMAIRLIGGIALVAAGGEVDGAVAAVLLSFFATWLVARRAGAGLPRPGRLDPAETRRILVFAGPVAAAQLGQILIANSDIIIVKHFFPPEDAGQYAALALVGRIVFFGTWSLVSTMYPIAAQRQQRGEPHRHLLGYTFGAVAIFSAAVLTATRLAPDLMIRVLFGGAYQAIAPLLWLYAAAAMLYALANVIVTYGLSTGRGGAGPLVLAAGCAQVAALWTFHGSPREVVVVQVLLMAGLLSLLIAWQVWIALGGQTLRWARSVR